MSQETSTYRIAAIQRSFKRLAILRETAVVTPKVDPKLADAIWHAAAAFQETLTSQAAGKFNGRLDRGLQLALCGSVTPDPLPDQPHRYQVLSSEGTQFYLVDLEEKTCTCPDSQKGNTCKHRVAAYFFEQAQKQLQLQQPKTKEVQQPRRATSYVKPTCTVPPQKEPQFKPTCSVPPTRADFELAELKAEKGKTQPEKQRSGKSEEQLLAELGFGPAKPAISENQQVKEPSYQLGTLYQRYLHGLDMDGQSYSVIIREITQERVTPQPSQPAYDKWCLWVSGLPDGMPGGVLFGARGERDLITIFGRIGLNELKGKTVVLSPETITVAGQKRVSIRFRGAA